MRGGAIVLASASRQKRKRGSASGAISFRRRWRHQKTSAASAA